MRFNLSQFTVRPGDEVRLVFEHIGDMPKATMGHNVVILRADVTAESFGNRVLSGGGTLDNDYLPPALLGDVLAHTRLLGGGEEDTITFTAPGPGNYTYLCTFPGHYGIMKGQMIVRG